MCCMNGVKCWRHSTAVSGVLESRCCARGTVCVAGGTLCWS